MAESEEGCCCEGSRGSTGTGCPGDKSTCNCCVVEAVLGCAEGTRFKITGC